MEEKFKIASAFSVLQLMRRKNKVHVRQRRENIQSKLCKILQEVIVKHSAILLKARENTVSTY